MLLLGLARRAHLISDQHDAVGAMVQRACNQVVGDCSHLCGKMRHEAQGLLHLPCPLEQRLRPHARDGGHDSTARSIWRENNRVLMGVDRGTVTSRSAAPDAASASRAAGRWAFLERAALTTLTSSSKEVGPRRAPLQKRNV